MKKYILSLILIITGVTGFSQHNATWYKTFVGKIGNMDAVLHLVSSEDYTGFIWFKQNRYPLSMNGNRMAGDSIRLYSMDGVLSVSLEGIIKKATITGQVTLDLTTDDQPGKKAFFTLQEDSSYTQFQELSARSESALPIKLKNASTFSAFRGTIWPESKTTFSSAIEKLVVQNLGLKNTEDIAGQIKAMCQHDSEKWLSDNLRLSSKDVAQMGLSLSVDTRDYVNVMYEDSKILIIAYFSFAYTGGAHGIYGTSLFTIDKSKGKLLQLGDILSDEGIKRLPSILDVVARAQFKIKKGSLTDNGFLVDYIPVSKSFYVTERGIGFLYNPYEIMPFAAGEVNLMVPFNALSAFLKADFKR